MNALTVIFLNYMSLQFFFRREGASNINVEFSAPSGLSKSVFITGMNERKDTSKNGIIYTGIDTDARQ